MDEETGLYYYGACYMEPQISIMLSVDGFAEKYPGVSPYAYTANNPVNYVDVNGDSIWFTRQGKEITMHVTDKVMDLSSRDIDMNEAISDISEGIAGTFSGSFEHDGEEYTFKTDIKLEATQSMDEVNESDHLFVFADHDGKGPARGTVNQIGGKTMFLFGEDFPTKGGLSGLFGWSSTRTAEHEFGHMAGLEHEGGFMNLMISGGSGWNLNSNQLKSVVAGRNSINRGNNYIKDPLTGRKYPNTQLRYNGSSANLRVSGLQLNLKKLK